MSLICCYYLEFEDQDQQDQFEAMLVKQGIAHYDATLMEIDIIKRNKGGLLGWIFGIEADYEGK
jgi:hypothetical protein